MARQDEDSSNSSRNFFMIKGFAKFQRPDRLLAIGGRKRGAGTAEKGRKIKVLKQELGAHP
jgi:hypothetical protein